MASGSVGATLYAIYKTAAITLPTVTDAVLGRLTIERADRRLADWSRSIVRHADVDLTVEGLNHVPRERACVYMSNHQNNIDTSIGAVLSGDDAFQAVAKWIETNVGWSKSAVFLTSDHGHYLVLDKPEALLGTVGN